MLQDFLLAHIFLTSLLKRLALLTVYRSFTSLAMVLLFLPSVLAILANEALLSRAYDDSSVSYI